MNYELALKLKNTGFPQMFKTPKRGKILNSKGETEMKLSERHYIYTPTLAELIEACGEDLYSIQFRANIPKTKCYVISKLSHNNGPVFSSQTPEEAVAHLWLSLQKKQ